jgi:hypothetical protein
MVAITVAIMFAVVGLYIYLRQGPAREVVKTENLGAQVNLGLTAREIETGLPPADQRRMEEKKAYQQSTGVSSEELSRRANETPQATAAAQQSETKAMQDKVSLPTLTAGEKPVSEKPAAVAAGAATGSAANGRRTTRNLEGGRGILGDIDDVAVQQKTGVTPEVAATLEPNRAGEKSAGPTSDLPYMPLHTRRLLAAQREASRSGSGESGGVAAAANTNPAGVPNMVTIERPDQPVKPAESAAPNPNAGAANSTGSGSSTTAISVNGLVPHTLQIPAVFVNNFIVSGAGADTSQRVIAQVEQDVYFRNRLQLPRGVRFVGTSGGVRDLDMVDVKWDYLQFPDGTSLAINGKAYQPYTPEYPDAYLMRGVVGEYEEPPLWSQVAPILISGVQGYATSNFDRLARRGISVANGAALDVATSSDDRLYGAASGMANKLADSVLQNLNRYRPRVRVRNGQPVIVILDEYADLSRRALNGAVNPMLNQSPARPRQDSGEGARTGLIGSALPSGASSGLPRELANALGAATPEQIAEAMRYLSGGSPAASPAVAAATPGGRIENQKTP